MARENYNELMAFLVVARERSFTRAAARLGVSQSALSHTIRGLESRLGVRLLTRSTRSVSPTDAGEALQRAIEPSFDSIDAALGTLGALRDTPRGTIRLTTGEHAATTIVWPVLATLLPRYPDIHVEVISDSSLTDIVADRFDAGIRLGEQLAKDMIAVPISPPMQLLVVGSPAYFAGRPVPRRPQDLTVHDCINIRFLTHGGLYAWEFEKDGDALNVRVEGRLTFNSTPQCLTAALAGFGLAYLMRDTVQAHVDAGRLRVVLEDWSPPFPGYHLYYPSRRQPSAAFTVLVDALRQGASLPARERA
ncbi:MAG TPA: LysR family transcriptional regulator [Tahibacter sp.]|nr:LysR family transcriptional regulator [Tahibacter sp.]